MNPMPMRIAIFGLLLSLPAAAAETFSNFGPERPLTLADLGVHLMDPEMYSEQWGLTIIPEGGGRAGADFIISNIGMGDHKAAVRGEYTDPAGKKYKCLAEYSSDEWNHQAGAFSLTLGANSLSGDFDGVRFKITCPELTLDLVMKNVSPPWQPGSGKLALEEDGKETGFYRMVYPSPRSVVTGTITAGGKTVQVQKGIGLCDHSFTNIGPHRLARRWFRFKHLAPEVSVLLVEVENPPATGGTTRGYAMVYDDAGRIVASARVRFEYDGWIQDTQSEEGYRIPRLVRVAAVDGSATLTGTFTMTKIEKVADPLADLDAIRRTVARRFSKPRDYYIGCKFSLRAKTDKGERTFSGEDVYKFVFVNP